MTQEFGSESCVPSHLASTLIVDSVSIVAQPPESETSDASNPCFHFTKPKTFVGRLAASSVQAPGPLIALSVNNQLRGNGRPINKSKKKKAGDGRADIRRLPDYDGDPIEGGSDD
ncbi:hypothetical protein CCHL11_07489 [Colletotrichum chlorophyti]|uniref:Uncharacterized protein n=1 Tax=Colletotrichum chlorophyti TaxID=708187 RepID=A0A1Q8RZH6_9PEZI|nr:hypothetical protein CCHL11_07489 [Colletotrichum chlorophyti]